MKAHDLSHKGLNFRMIRIHHYLILMTARCQTNIRHMRFQESFLALEEVVVDNSDRRLQALNRLERHWFRSILDRWSW